MSKTKLTDEQQDHVDRCWDLYNAAMEACEELEACLHDLQFVHGIDASKANEAAAEAHGILHDVYSSGSKILPTYSGDI